MHIGPIGLLYTHMIFYSFLLYSAAATACEYIIGKRSRESKEAP